MKNVNEQKNRMFQAVEDCNLSSLKHCVEVEKMSLKDTTTNKQTAAHIAAKKRELEILKYLVQKEATLVNSADLYGNTPLLTAIQEGALDIVKYLVGQCKVSVIESCKRLQGNTPIHLAAQAGHLEILKYFVKTKRVDINVKNDLGETPAFLAADQTHLDVIKFLVEETKANLTLTDNKKDNILFVSALNGDATIPKYLLDERKLEFDINKRDRLGRSIVFLAAGLQHLDFLKYFVGEKHANVNLRDSWGRTPLHQAVMTDNIHVVKYLIEQGATPGLKDHNGKMPSEMTDNSNLSRYLERTEENNRSRRSTFLWQNYLAAQVFEKYSNNWMVTHRTGSENLIDGQRLSTFDRIDTLSQIDNFFFLFGVWSAKRFSSTQANYWSFLQSRATFEDGIDPLNIFIPKVHQKKYL